MVSFLILLFCYQGRHILNNGVFLILKCFFIYMNSGKEAFVIETYGEKSQIWNLYRICPVFLMKFKKQQQPSSKYLSWLTCFRFFKRLECFWKEFKKEEQL